MLFCCYVENSKISNMLLFGIPSINDSNLLTVNSIFITLSKLFKEQKSENDFLANLKCK